MNKYEIHVLLIGFATQPQHELLKMLRPLPINLHQCDIDTPLSSVPNVHVLLMGMDNVNNQNSLTTAGQINSEENQSNNSVDIIENFVEKLLLASPHCLVYLLAPADKILSLTQRQKEQFRDFIIYPVNEVFLKKRLFRIINDLQEKFIQLVKKRKLKKILAESEYESQQTKASLEASAKSIVQANKHLIRMLSNQVFARMGQRASGRNQQLNLLLVEIAKAADFSETEILELTDAWHLRNIGKMGFSDKILHTPYVELSADEQRVFNCHPTLSHAAMMVVRPLDKASKIVLQHKEYIDGSGYPFGLIAEKVPKQAQLLTVLTDYTELVAGRYLNRSLSTVEALAYLENYASEKYSDIFVNHLVNILPVLSKNGQGMHDLIVISSELTAGTVLSRDLISSEGILLLSEGQRMDRVTITRIKEMEGNLQTQFKFYIHNN